MPLLPYENNFLLCCFFLGNLLGEMGFIFAEHIVHHAFVDQNRFWRGRRSKNQFCAGIGFSVGNSGANAVGVVGESIGAQGVRHTKETLNFIKY